ncbi:polysaccharide biosynthesis protein [Patescibacteria group bacterium]|nr:polysaccharide biosynthesis protein [Patescibacteria group bacterium]
MILFENKTIVITGGTGSLGKVLTKRLLTGNHGRPKKIIIFSRDEAKQYYMRLEYLKKRNATEEIIYDDYQRILDFRIGDIRDYHSVRSVLRDADIVINAAALKQVPSCEYFPFEAVQTNILGPQNIIRAIEEGGLKISAVVGVSTDKACRPVNVMGMTKALQERLFITANLNLPYTRFICVRYGNVLASRGSVIPLFHDQIKNGGPVTVTTKDMTRFLLTLEKAVDTILAALGSALPGEIYIPIIPSSNINNVAKALIGNKKISISYTGIRPGEKIYEELVSEEESHRTYKRGDYYVIKPVLSHFPNHHKDGQPIKKSYSSTDNIMSLSNTRELLSKNDLLLDKELKYEGELLR